MNLRCSYCQTMFSLSRDTMLAALQQMADENLHHFDAHCPKCRRANSLARERLERANPGWQQALETMRKEAAKAKREAVKPEKEPAVNVVTKPAAEKKAPPASAPAKTPTEQRILKAIASPKVKKPAAKKSTAKKPAMKKQATKKPVAKKPVAKK